jgi:two-component system CheB/CheR fusion protein
MADSGNSFLHEENHASHEATELSPDITEEALGLGIDGCGPVGELQTLPIVGLGGSAGSIQALQAFFEQTPTNSGAVFVVILHLSPDHASTLAELLQRSTRMPVVQVNSRTKVEANSVYVIPPAKQLAMADGHLTLSDLDRPQGKRVAIDLFFRTLADTHGRNATAIILSGGDSDGTIGIKRIKERGGLTIAQDPAEAQHDSMPRAAIATGMVDWVLPIQEMPGRWLAYLRNADRLKLPSDHDPKVRSDLAPLDANTENALREVLVFLRTRTGRDFSYYKRATILRRIARRMQVNDVLDIGAYLVFLRTHPGEAVSLLQDLLISVTNFFRDRSAFYSLEEMIPKVFEGKNSSEDQIRVWTTACATGEEAYSIAMLLSEHASGLDSPPKIQVFATDIDQDAIDSARDGFYPETIAADVSEDRLRRFFTKEHGGYRVKRFLRELVLFALHDVLRDSPFSRLDLISSRNLMIYLNREAQARAFEIFHFALRPDGLLFLGSSESIEEGRSLFASKDKKQRIYIRRAINRTGLAAPAGAFTLARTFALRRPGDVPFAANTNHAPKKDDDFSPRTIPSNGERISWGELHLKLIDRIAPPSLLIDGDYNIIHLSESAGRFLQFTGGEPSMNLLRVVNPSLRLDLRAALFRASQSGAPAEISDILFEVDGVLNKTDIAVTPARDLAPDLLLVTFKKKEELPKNQVTSPAEPQGATRLLEQELEHVKDLLRDTIEQHEGGTEELKASNEELQAVNEELRSATEELETSREELQSINEELTTVNQELKSKVDETARTNSDLQNLMAATSIATIFLDRDLCIKRYTPPSVALFNLILTDVGRPLSDLTPRLDYPTITEDAQSVLDNLTVLEREKRSYDDRWYLIRLLPYRTSEDQIAGIVLTFVDITQRRKSEEDLRSSEERYRTLFNSIDEAFSVLDIIFDEQNKAVDYRFLEVNPAFAKLTGLNDVVGKRVRDIMPEHEDHWLKFYGAVALTGNPARHVNVARTAGENWYDSYAFRIGGPDSRKIAVLFTDITERRNSEEQLKQALEDTKRSRADAEVAATAKDRFLAVLSHELRTPLTPILMTVGSLGRRTDIPERVREGLEMIRRNVEIEAHFIDDLLDLTRITRQKFEIVRSPVELHEAIRGAIDISQPDILAKNQHLTVALDAEAHVIMGDFARIQQVVWNLLKNSSKFTPNDGNIHLATRNEDGHIQVIVTDTGIGIEAEVLPRIFDAFTQGGESVAREFGGLGLGLAISKASIDAHNGMIEAQSFGPNKGAAFTVTLPLALADAESSQS